MDDDVPARLDFCKGVLELFFDLYRQDIFDVLEVPFRRAIEDGDQLLANHHLKYVVYCCRSDDQVERNIPLNLLAVDVYVQFLRHLRPENRGCSTRLQGLFREIT